MKQFDFTEASSYSEVYNALEAHVLNNREFPISVLLGDSREIILSSPRTCLIFLDALSLGYGLARRA